MMEVAFAIVLSFSDWDECWNWYHAQTNVPEAEMLCTKFERERATLAPTRSLRPRVRPD